MRLSDIPPSHFIERRNKQLLNYLSKVLPELSEDANKYEIRHPRLQPPVHKQEYIKGACRCRPVMLLKKNTNKKLLFFF